MTAYPASSAFERPAASRTRPLQSAIRLPNHSLSPSYGNARLPPKPPAMPSSPCPQRPDQKLDLGTHRRAPPGCSGPAGAPCAPPRRGTARRCTSPPTARTRAWPQAAPPPAGSPGMRTDVRTAPSLPARAPGSATRQSARQYIRLETRGSRIRRMSLLNNCITSATARKEGCMS